MRIVHKTWILFRVGWGNHTDFHKIEGTAYATQLSRGRVQIDRVLARMQTNPKSRDCSTFQTVDITPLYRGTEAGKELEKEIMEQYNPSTEEG